MNRIPAIRGMPQVITAAICLVILIAVFSLISEDFASERNLRNLPRRTAPVLIAGIAQSVVLISGNIDLSIGSVAGMSCMISATLMARGVSPLNASIITLICCLIAGIINGLLVARGRLPSFIATLGTMMVIRGIAQIINKNGRTELIGETARAFRNLLYYGEQQFFGLRVFNTVLIALFLWVIFSLILSFTRTGRNLYAAGNNADAARMSGVNVPASVTAAYAASSLCACIVGLITCATDGFGRPDAGTMYEMYAIAASVTGGISVLGGKGLLLGTLVGASVWTVLQNGLMLAGPPTAAVNIASGIIIVIAVLRDVFVREDKRKNQVNDN